MYIAAAAVFEKENEPGIALIDSLEPAGFPTLTGLVTQIKIKAATASAPRAHGAIEKRTRRNPAEAGARATPS